MNHNLTLAAFADEAGRSLDSQINALKRNQIDRLEIRFVDANNIADITAAQAREIHDKLASKGISVWSIGSPFGKINIKDDFDSHLDSFRRCIENAYILKANCIRLFSFYGVTTNAERDVAMERLTAFVDAAKGSHIVLCHENEKGVYGDNAKRCLEILREIPTLKAVFDPANFVQCGQEIKEAWSLLKEYTYYLHIKDALASGKIVPAGDGIGELPYLVREFAKQGGGVMTLEPHLKIFEGLSSLETEEKTFIDHFTYPDNDTAFDAACNAIKQVVTAI